MALGGIPCRSDLPLGARNSSTSDLLRIAPTLSDVSLGFRHSRTARLGFLAILPRGTKVTLKVQ